MKAPEKPTGHSPLGASGAYRWLECPGSVGFSRGHSDSESEYAAEGTAAHALAARCLTTGKDAWEYVNGWVHKDAVYDPGDAVAMEVAAEGFRVTTEMANAVQVYLEYIRTTFPDRHQGNFFVERRFHCPTIHKLFYGTTDAAGILDKGIGSGLLTLEIVDYKHGAGIVVDADDNPQLMYYAAGMLEDLQLWESVNLIRMTIVQPRGFHFNGPIRTAEISAEELRAWVDHILVPGMDHAMVSRNTKSGEHCQFCPARGKACPQLMQDMDEMEELMDIIEDAQKEGSARELTNQEVARMLELLERAKIVGKAANATAFNRLQAGQSIPGLKLGMSRTNREFKDGAEAEARKQFGDRAYNPPALKSPAQIDELPLGKDFTKRWAYKPEGKQTVLRADDARPAVDPKTKSMFKPVTAQKRSGK